MVFGIIVSPPTQFFIDQSTISTLSCKEILKRVILLSVIKIWLFFDCFINSGITEPLLPSHYHTHPLKRYVLLPFILFAARNNLSEQVLSPRKGLQAQQLYQ